MTRRHSSSLISRNGLLGRSAALFSSASTAPNFLIASSAMRLQSSGLPTSPMTTSVSAPSFCGFLGDALAGGAIARAVEHDVEAVLGQAQHAGAADVAARAGDQRGLPRSGHQMTPLALRAAIALPS